MDGAATDLRRALAEPPAGGHGPVDRASDRRAPRPTSGQRLLRRWSAGHRAVPGRAIRAADAPGRRLARGRAPAWVTSPLHLHGTLRSTGAYRMGALADA